MTYHCSLTTCRKSTLFPNKKNPRLRWIVDMILKDENDKEIKLTLCPEHAREYLKLDEEIYQRIERTEKFVQENARLN